MTTEESTQDLVKRAQTGDRRAFDDLAIRYREELRSFVGSRLGAGLQGKIDVEDVVQEALFKAFRSLAGFCWKGERSFPRWLAGIANHLMLHLARQHRPERICIESIESDVRGDTNSPSKSVRRNERFDRLKESLESLSPEHREVILLMRIEGIPVDEVARRMSRSPKATRQLLWRALQNLRESFGDTESLGLPDRRLGEEGCRK